MRHGEALVAFMLLGGILCSCGDGVRGEGDVAFQPPPREDALSQADLDGPEPRPDDLAARSDVPVPKPDIGVNLTDALEPEPDRGVAPSDAPEPEPDREMAPSDAPEPEPDREMAPSDAPEPEPDRWDAPPDAPEPEPDREMVPSDAPEPEPDREMAPSDAPEPEPDRWEAPSDAPEPEPDRIEPPPDAPEPEPDRIEPPPDAPEPDDVEPPPDAPEPECIPGARRCVDGTTYAVCQEGGTEEEHPCPSGQTCQAGVCQGGTVVVDCGSDVPGYCYIPPGTFTMGSPGDEFGRWAEEGPQHEVSITRGFYLKATEVTQGEWEAVFGNNPSYFGSCGVDCPLEKVNWWESLEYCNALSDGEGLGRCYELTGCVGLPGEDRECAGVTFLGLDCTGYRLPTEAEWEYAARAGTTTAFYTGEINETGWGLDPNLDAAGWYRGNADGTPHPVAQKEPNGWGLYDMHGNVWEWVWDWFDGRYYAGSPLDDPLGPGEGSNRVLRGGSWNTYAEYCRSAYRYFNSPGLRYGDLGFRPSRSGP